MAKLSKFQDFMHLFAIPKWKPLGADLIDAAEQFCQQYPNDTVLIRCDDAVFSNSVIVAFIEERANYKHVTCIFIPQCYQSEPTIINFSHNRVKFLQEKISRIISLLGNDKDEE